MTFTIVSTFIVLFVLVIFSWYFGFVSGLKKGFSVWDNSASKWAQVYCVIGSSIFLVGLLVSTSYSIYFITNSNKVTAVVTDLREKIDKDGNVNQYPVFQYHDQTGQGHTSTTKMVAPKDYQIGDEIPVLYLKNAPNSSRIDYFVYHWFLSLFCASGMIILTGVYLFLKKKSKNN